MIHRSCGAPAFEHSRAFYVGLNKVSGDLVAGKDTIVDHTYSAIAKLKAVGVAFLCLKVHDRPTSGVDAEVSYLGWGQGRPVAGWS